MTTPTTRFLLSWLLWLWLLLLLPPSLTPRLLLLLPLPPRPHGLPDNSGIFKLFLLLLLHLLLRLGWFNHIDPLDVRPPENDKFVNFILRRDGARGRPVLRPK